MLLRGKTGAVFGVSNEKSIAWSIAKAWMGNGSKLLISVENERFISRINKLCEKQGWNSSDFSVVQCDVNKESEVKSSLHVADEKFGGLDMLLHAIAFAPKPALESVLNCTRDNFRQTFDTSVFSLITLTNEAAPLLQKRGGGSVIALSFNGSERVVPGYGMMGPAKGALESTCRYLAYELGEHNIRVNAISPGPLNTLAARGIPNFHELRRNAEIKSPLSKVKTLKQEDVAQCAVFLAADGSSAITGQTIRVDCGYGTVA
mmetsp:Transcript_14087/g.17465  ORF Transcript_14087/g.17465 Transcript_14087/m.17465 type:complete len:261 (-) Transcript_14087:1518-2300(-)